MKRWTIVHVATFNHPFIHWFVQTCKGKDRETISTSGSTHGAGLNQQTRNLLCEIRVQKQSSPFSETPNPAQTHTHLSFNQHPPHQRPMTHSFSRDPSPSPLPTVNHAWGCREGGELEVRPGQRWVVALSDSQHGHSWWMRVCTCAGSPPIFTHNPLPPLCFFGHGNGGCHGQSPELPADLLQVALWLLSSPRSCPDPWPLTPGVCPMP